MEKYSSLARLMVARVAGALVILVFLAGSACASRPTSGPAASVEALSSANCNAVKMPKEPELMGWEPAQRAQLDKLRRQGVVAVRYEQQGCEVTLTLLPDCVGPKNKYVYTPMGSADSRIAHNVDDLLAQLPVGAGNTAGLLKKDQALRTDFKLVGAAALPVGTTISEYDLVGAACKQATHIVSAVYVGGFGLATETEPAGTNAFTSGEAMTKEGFPAICDRAQLEGIALDGCSTPLRVALIPLNGAAPPPTCPAGWTFDGKKCTNGAVAAGPVDAGIDVKSGAFDQLAIERVVRVKSPTTTRICWDGAPQSIRSVSVNIATTVDTHGKVAVAEPQLVVADGANDVANTVARCIANDVMTWEFPPPDAAQSIVLPFHLMRQ